MRTILALDQSTSATKALLFDEYGHVLDREALPHQQIYPRPGWVEHDAEEIWRNALAVLRAVTSRAQTAGRSPAFLSLTNQRETIVVFERGTGRPLGHALVWQDRRGDALCAAQAAKGREPTIHARTGLKLDAYFSASKLQWLLRERPLVRRALEAGEAVCGTIDAYLIHRLTNGAVFATDATNASRTLLFDITRLNWDDELCAWWEVQQCALPEVRECSGRFGETTLHGVLGEPLPICGVMGDSQASLFAQRCFAPGNAKVTFGTGSSVLLNIGSQPRFSSHGVVTALGWVLAGSPVYTFEGIIITAAATFTWLCDQLGLVRDVNELASLAAEVDDTGGVYLVPAFSGLGLPHWRPDARAAIVGLTSHSDRRHVARAAFEAIAYQLRDALEVMRTEGGVDLDVLQADGGPTQNAQLMQITADITRTELRVSDSPDASPWGAAMAGMLGMGWQASLSTLVATARSEVVYRPQAENLVIERRCAGWRRAVTQVAGADPAAPER
jgi:glycerol kinase